MGYRDLGPKLRLLWEARGHSKIPTHACHTCRRASVSHPERTLKASAGGLDAGSADLVRPGRKISLHCCENSTHLQRLAGFWNAWVWGAATPAFEARGVASERPFCAYKTFHEARGASSERQASIDDENDKQSPRPGCRRWPCHRLPRTLGYGRDDGVAR